MKLLLVVAYSTLPAPEYALLILPMLLFRRSVKKVLTHVGARGMPLVGIVTCDPVMIAAGIAAAALFIYLLLGGAPSCCS